jgi:hypothetical protein
MHALRTSQNWGSQNVQAVMGVESISSGGNFPICLPPRIHLAHFDPTTRLHCCSTPAGKHHDVRSTRMVDSSRLAFLADLGVYDPADVST